MRGGDFAAKLHEQTGMPITRFSGPPENGEGSGQLEGLDPGSG